MSDEIGSPRGVWAWLPLRFIVMFVVLAALDLGCQFGIAMAAKGAPGVPKDLILAVGVLLLAIVMIAAYRLLVRGMESRRASELGFAKAVPLTLGGTLLGACLFCIVLAALFTLGVAKYQGVGTTDGLLIAFAMAVGAAVGEEIVFRGVVYRLFEEGFGTAVALVLSGALFGLLHAGNHGATFASTIAIALEAGVMLAAAYALTRSLWLPIGLHLGWNFTEGGIFGTAVSGGTLRGLLSVRLVGPEGLTGGEFGPEASVAAVVVCVSAAAVILAAAARRGQWQPMRIRLRSPR